MDFETLKRAYDREKVLDHLAPLEDDFYSRVAEYVKGLREAQRTATKTEAEMLGDTISQSMYLAEAIADLRLAKIKNNVEIALTWDEIGMREYCKTAFSRCNSEEKALYEGLLSLLKGHKQKIMATLGGLK